MAFEPGLHFASKTLCSTLPLSTVLPSFVSARPERELSGWQRSPDYDVCIQPRQLYIIHSSLTWVKKRKATQHSKLLIIRALILVLLELSNPLRAPCFQLPLLSEKGVDNRNYQGCSSCLLLVNGRSKAFGEGREELSWPKWSLKVVDFHCLAFWCFLTLIPHKHEK